MLTDVRACRIDPRVVTAIHAPTSKNWTSTFTLQQGYPFGGGFQGGMFFFFGFDHFGMGGFVLNFICVDPSMCVWCHWLCGVWLI